MEKKKTKKTRTHYVLFCMNTPFKPKRVESKVAYKRRDKHKVKKVLDYE